MKWKWGNKSVFTGSVIIISFLLVALCAPWMAPHPPGQVNLNNRLMNPNTEYPLGTDHLGRCLMSRTIYGTRYTLGVAFLVLIVVFILSIVLGSVSGYYGSLIDEVVMRLVDIFLAFPPIILAVTVVGLLGPGIKNLMFAMCFIWWANVSRVIRGAVISIKQREFIDAVRVLGAGDKRIIFRHILPNMLPSVTVLLSLEMGSIILSISGLNFLGLGVSPPAPEWGALLNEGYPYMETAPHLMVVPGVAIALSVLGCHLFGEGMRDLMDKRGY